MPSTGVKYGLPQVGALTAPAIPGTTSHKKYQCNLFLSEIDKQRLTEKYKVVEVNLKAKINSNCRKLSQTSFQSNALSKRISMIVDNEVNNKTMITEGEVQESFVNCKT